MKLILYWAHLGVFGVGAVVEHFLDNLETSRPRSKDPLSRQKEISTIAEKEVSRSRSGGPLNNSGSVPVVSMRVSMVVEL